MSLRFPVEPRMLPPEKIARRIGVTASIFAEKKADLERAGFPKPDAVLGHYSLDAVDQWIDRQAGLTRPGDAVSDPAAIMGRVRERSWRK